MTPEAMGQQRWARRARQTLGWPARSRPHALRSARERALYDAALPAARAWSVAAAFGLFVLGFALDDARWVRMPGFLLGMGGAFVALAFGSAAVARALARRLVPLEATDAQRAIAWQVLGARVAAVSLVTLFLLWLMVTSGGVTSWFR